jgi:predicted O-methyltransferase YrrM
MNVIQHEDTWLELSQLGRSMPYRLTYSGELALGPAHRRLLEAPRSPGAAAIDVGIPGSLRREDAAKLYELTLFGQSNVLELGCARGLSTSIIAQAVADSGQPRAIITVDLDARMIDRARGNLAELGLMEHVTPIQGDAYAICSALIAQHRTFDFVFVDHSHSYHDVLAVCTLLIALVQPDGFVLFHDFNDRRNRDETNDGYGVYSAVLDGLPIPPFSFFGIFGCTGLFRHVAAGDAGQAGQFGQ